MMPKTKIIRRVFLCGRPLLDKLIMHKIRKEKLVVDCFEF